jgi:thiol-disulfide isomerase/thioredoxin
MDLVLVIARLFLAVIFAVAGIAKLWNFGASKKAIADFGAPTRVATFLGYVLPLLELVIAFLLLSAETVVWGATGSLGLLIVFVGAIGLNLAQGKRPDCQCFGQLHSKPIGPSLLVRNLILAAGVAGLLQQSLHRPSLSLLAGARLLFSEPAALPVAVGILALIVAGHAYLTLHLFRQNGRLLLRIEALEGAPAKIPGLPAMRPGLAVGSRAPEFELPAIRGDIGSLDGLLKLGKPVLLIFSDAACGPCKALMPQLVQWQAEHAQKLTVAVITRGVSKEKPGKQPDLEYLFLQQNREVADQYRAFGTPSAVLVGKDGLMAHSLASGAAAIGDLVQAAASGNLPAAPAMRSSPPSMRNTLPIGSPAPELTLPDLYGKPTRLADFHGHDTILLFWNPECGFCTRMLPRLIKWELSRPRSTPRIVLISAGTAEENRAMGLCSSVLLDQGLVSMRLFGVGGTPSALLVDETGKIKSGIAVGADAVLSLAEAAKPPRSDATGTGLIELTSG